ncbi:hypothetical protein [Mycobacterium sp. 852002-40037_SCH5390672]|uniref:hypothetical protein n=1 Tax=Mycobacterium sp. 852002-40037_SCH5390672 TaxID=1834089 RepID=UPI000805C292|nr:hypothetical protein [Mycobacterium sp. 852002-40037_SCH5390672]OBB92960.1 hypothetical protein A5782_12120 [Mycobacterium sp. 852002-40037_SCH5390672]
MTGFGHLMAPGRIGAMRVRNRLLVSPIKTPIKTRYGTPDGLPPQRRRRLRGAFEPDTTLFGLVDALPGTEVHAAGDCTGLGLIRNPPRKARAACAI